MRVLASLLMFVVATTVAELIPYSRNDPNDSGYSHGSYGPPNYGRNNYNYHVPFAPLRGFNKPLNELDKLYSRLDSVLAQLKAYSEQYESLAARVANQNRRLDQLTDVKIPERQGVDNVQASTIDDMNDLLGTLADQVNNDVSGGMETLGNMNGQNLNNLDDVQARMDSMVSTNAQMVDEAATLSNAVHHAKDMLLQLEDSAFQPVRDALAAEQSMLNNIQAEEDRAVCETGQVTLDSENRRGEYQYRTPFNNVPQVLYGICGFNLNLDARKDNNAGFVFQPREPNSGGLRANAYSTMTGLTLELFDLGFADTSVVTADVCFQACSLGPGFGTVNV